VTKILRLMIVALAAGILGAGEPAVCEGDGCPQVGCNDELPCPGAACGCVQRPGQPFGRCAPY
jgi:hypothetical protein